MLASEVQRLVEGQSFADAEDRVATVRGLTDQGLRTRRTNKVPARTAAIRTTSVLDPQGLSKPIVTFATTAED